MDIKYCNQCGSNVRIGIPDGDNRQRHICDHCDTVHYQNPKIVTGCIPVWEDKVLLCKRAIEPRYGLWTVPAGFMENGETTHQGAVRETWEEAQAKVTMQALYMTVNLPQINQVYMLFRAQLNNLDFAPGEESLEVDLFTQQQIPWEQLAFPSVALALQHYFSDVEQGHFPMRMADIMPDSNSPQGFNVTAHP